MIYSNSHLHKKGLTKVLHKFEFVQEGFSVVKNNDVSICIDNEKSETVSILLLSAVSIH